ncbi:DNA polymerase III subunit chi [Aestuariirhabdus litorea]|uniref:DNA polymerase III subunit chi n=1 Tax=Aestuariirhabdus litorea TaxID=2528527 RepID=A0A3P3VTN5_9GAMM|nr:DNA polymerase III subunit chi [Aestuariirhabdus litorea]RRJ85328.1 DNA polymerase III subunit chi [Aestuariirhabdus litorea]RWW98550.1 DNA polymerase III subunit chi [Endozoicomonadaceae bacterium GTF-13]
MTRVDFYLLPGVQRQDALLFSCRLAEKAYQLGHRVFIHTQDDTQAQQLDDLLWSYRGERFLPHQIRSLTGEGAPIEVGHTEEAGDHHDLLINLADRIPDCFGRFTRVAEIVTNHEDAKRQSRDNYRFYQQRGYPMHTHRIRG